VVNKHSCLSEEPSRSTINFQAGLPLPLLLPANKSARLNLKTSRLTADAKVLQITIQQRLLYNKQFLCKIFPMINKYFTLTETRPIRSTYTPAKTAATGWAPT
jgi:hypothetical protein